MRERGPIYRSRDEKDTQNRKGSARRVGKWQDELAAKFARRRDAERSSSEPQSGEVDRNIEIACCIQPISSPWTPVFGKG